MLWDKFRQLHENGFGGGSMPGAVAISVVAGIAAGAMCWHGLILGPHPKHDHTPLKRHALRLLAAIFWAAVVLVAIYLMVRARSPRTDLLGYDPDAALSAAAAAGAVTLVGV